MTGLFVTGTDTGVGKTLVAAALLHALAARGLRVVGMKPVAAGCEQRDGETVNEDVLALAAASNVQAPRDWINPYRFAEPIAPHLAAASAGVSMDLDHLVRCYDALAAHADRVVVEGAGGFLVPLDEGRTLADLAVRLGLPVVLVVGMRLGCLNHALLTREAIRARGLTLAGWVANSLAVPMPRFDDNLAYLERALAAPLLGVIPPLGPRPCPRSAAACLRLPEAF